MGKKLYTLYMNGRLYGTGPLEHIHQLLRDYVLVMEMYGKEEVRFKVVEGIGRE